MVISCKEKNDTLENTNPKLWVHEELMMYLLRLIFHQTSLHDFSYTKVWAVLTTATLWQQL